MKCLILAGGQGERLWPLSRKNYPKLRFEKISFRCRYSDKNLIENAERRGYSDGKNFVGQRKIGEW